MSQLPTATPMQRTFFNWNFTVALISLTLDSNDSWWFTRVGNFPAFTYKLAESMRNYHIEKPGQPFYMKTVCKEIHRHGALIINLPALLRPGPKRRGICLMTDSDAKKAWYCLESFLTNFLFLFSFFNASTSIHCKPIDVACQEVNTIKNPIISENIQANKSQTTIQLQSSDNLTSQKDNSNPLSL